MLFNFLPFSPKDFFEKKEKAEQIQILKKANWNRIYELYKYDLDNNSNQLYLLLANNPSIFLENKSLTDKKPNHNLLLLLFMDLYEDQMFRILVRPPGKKEMPLFNFMETAAKALDLDVDLAMRFKKLDPEIHREFYGEFEKHIPSSLKPKTTVAAKNSIPPKATIDYPTAALVEGIKDQQTIFEEVLNNPAAIYEKLLGVPKYYQVLTLAAEKHGFDKLNTLEEPNRIKFLSGLAVAALENTGLADDFAKWVTASNCSNVDKDNLLSQIAKHIASSKSVISSLEQPFKLIRVMTVISALATTSEGNIKSILEILEALSDIECLKQNKNIISQIEQLKALSTQKTVEQVEVNFSLRLIFLELNKDNSGLLTYLPVLQELMGYTQFFELASLEQYFEPYFSAMIKDRTPEKAVAFIKNNVPASAKKQKLFDYFYKTHNDYLLHASPKLKMF